MDTRTEIENVIPKEKVIEEAQTFLARCGWELEVNEDLVRIPPNVELCVRSRAFIKADLPDVFLGDHYEATVLIGCEEVNDNICAEYAVLKLYFDESGHFVSEDRYSKFS
jgi:hypothetical protein